MYLINLFKKNIYFSTIIKINFSNKILKIKNLKKIFKFILINLQINNKLHFLKIFFFKKILSKYEYYKLHKLINKVK